MITPTHYEFFGWVWSLQWSNLLVGFVLMPLIIGLLLRANKILGVTLFLGITFLWQMNNQVFSSELSNVCRKKAIELIQKHFEVFGNAPCNAFEFSLADWARLTSFMLPGLICGVAIEIVQNRLKKYNAPNN